MRGKPNIALRILAVVGIVVVAYAIILCISASHLLGTVESLSAKATTCQQQMDEGNITEAVTSLRNMAKDCESLKSEADMPQWQIASVLPVIGDDVRCARGLATIGDSLSNDALIPVLKEADDLGILDQENIDALNRLIGSVGQDVTGTGNGTGSSSDAQKLNDSLTLIGTLVTIFTEKSADVDELMASLTKARTVLDECRHIADTLPESHFEQLKKTASQVKTFLDDADDTLDGIEAFIAEVNSGINSLFSGVSAAPAA